MRYFGIKTPGSTTEAPYIWWITNSEHNSWMAFFTYPNRDNEFKMYRLSISEAIRAYEAIGYKCVELELGEVSARKEVGLFAGCFDRDAATDS